MFATVLQVAGLVLLTVGATVLGGPGGLLIGLGVSAGYIGVAADRDGR